MFYHCVLCDDAKPFPWNLSNILNCSTEFTESSTNGSSSLNAEQNDWNKWRWKGKKHEKKSSENMKIYAIIIIIKWAYAL